MREAILAADAGDTVLVEPGLYFENVVVDRDVVLRSRCGPHMTTIDGSGWTNPDSASVVYLTAGSVEGFAIRGGSGTLHMGAIVGGGVFCIGTEAPGPLIQHNWIHGNRLMESSYSKQGAGIWAKHAARVIENRVFDNEIDEGSGVGHSGAGIAHEQGTLAALFPRIERNEVFDNRMVAGELVWVGAAAGVSVGDGILRDNIIACNSAYGYSGVTAAGLIERNTIAANWSETSSAAIVIWGGQDNEVTALANCVTNNVGPGMECWDFTSPPTATYVLECNNFFGNGPGGQVAGECIGAIGQDGNISVDPLYGRFGCEAGVGNWCLSEISPLLLDPPPGCGLIGALGLCPPIGIGERSPGNAPRLRVSAPRPNPFIERTSISLLMPESGDVEIGIYNVLGRRVRLVEAGWLVEGVHVIQWDGRDHDGQKVASGAYVARIRAGGEELTRTLLLVR